MQAEEVHGAAYPVLFATLRDFLARDVTVP
jgi:hypothetical protein